jgi:cytochrome c553
MSQKGMEAQTDALNEDDLADLAAFIQNCDEDARAENALTQ